MLKWPDIVFFLIVLWASFLRDVHTTLQGKKYIIKKDLAEYGNKPENLEKKGAKGCL
jgi:hypothetical protein